jgi:hypothetical protein
MSSPGHNQLFTSQPPFYKEGIVMRKHLLESGDQKAKNRDWKECFVIVNRGDLHMYSLSPNGGEANHRRSMLRASSASLVNLADSLKSGSNTFSNTMQPQQLSVSDRLSEGGCKRQFQYMQRYSFNTLHLFPYLPPFIVI